MIFNRTTIQTRVATFSSFKRGIISDALYTPVVLQWLLPSVTSRVVWSGINSRWSDWRNRNRAGQCFIENVFRVKVQMLLFIVAFASLSFDDESGMVDCRRPSGLRDLVKIIREPWSSVVLSHRFIKCRNVSCFYIHWVFICSRGSFDNSEDI